MLLRPRHEQGNEIIGASGYDVSERAREISARQAVVLADQEMRRIGLKRAEAGEIRPPRGPARFARARVSDDLSIRW